MARNDVATVGILALPIACCAGLSLLLAAGLSAGALAALGGAGAGLIGFAAALLILGARRRRAPCPSPRRDRDER